MAKNKVARTWFYTTQSLTVSGGGTIAAGTLLNQTEGTLSQGVKLMRCFGSWSALATGIVAGSDHIINAWHGLLLGSDEASGVEKWINSSGDDENQAWLWREPLVLFPCGRVSGAGTWHIDGRFDWAVRGGRGSNLGDGQQFEYVVSIDNPGSGALTSLKVEWRAICLYGVV